MTPPLKLIVGLGNPGAQYERTRHNIGFMLVDLMVKHFEGSAFRKKFHGVVAEASIGGTPYFFLKPHTYMNHSGRAIAEMAGFYKIPAAEILVLHDDLDLAFLKLRIKQGGGSGGHNGLKSIDAHLGQEYWRMRLGIAHPGEKHRVLDYVLQNFSSDEESPLEEWLKIIAEQFPLWQKKGPQALMSAIAMKINPKTNV